MHPCNTHRYQSSLFELPNNSPKLIFSHRTFADSRLTGNVGTINMFHFMFVDLTVKAKMGPSKKYKLYSKLHKLLTVVFLLKLPYAARLIDQVRN